MFREDDPQLARRCRIQRAQAGAYCAKLRHWRLPSTPSSTRIHDRRPKMTLSAGFSGDYANRRLNGSAASDANIVLAANRDDSPAYVRRAIPDERPTESVADESADIA